MDGIHHQLQRGINNGTRFFGIKSFDQRRGAFEVSKERGDDFPLAVSYPPGFHRRLFGPNAVSEMGRGVGSWGSGTRNGCSACPHQYLATLISGQLFSVDQLVLKPCKILIVKVELELQRPI